jgi:hypothetical protein
MATLKFKEELKKIWQFLQSYRNEAIVIIAALLFLSLHRYHIIWNVWFSD